MSGVQADGRTGAPQPPLTPPPPPPTGVALKSGFIE
jgi:hypothetical protein